MVFFLKFNYIIFGYRQLKRRKKKKEGGGKSSVTSFVGGNKEKNVLMNARPRHSLLYSHSLPNRGLIVFKENIKLLVLVTSHFHYTTACVFKILHYFMSGKEYAFFSLLHYDLKTLNSLSSS